MALKFPLQRIIITGCNRHIDLSQFGTIIDFDRRPDLDKKHVTITMVQSVDFGKFSKGLMRLPISD